MTIYFWADGRWCLKEDLHGMAHRSDDYGMFTLPDENHYEDWQIDMLVREKL